LINGLLIYLNNENITGKILVDSFPEYIEEAFKGIGLFEFEASDLTFKVFGKIAKRDDDVLIKYATTGEVVFAGFVDEVDDDTSGIQEITACSYAVKLKDAKIGEEVDTGDDEIVREFDTDGQKSVKEIVLQVIQAVYDRIGLKIYADDDTIKINPGSVKKFFGNILRVMPRQGLIAALIDLVFPGDRGYQIRTKSGQTYIIEQDASFEMKTFWEKASFVNWTLQVPPWTINLGVTKIKKGAWINFHILVPPFDLKFPTIGAKYWIYRCVTGGLEHIRTHGFFPLPPFFDGPPDLEGLYGKKHTSNSSNNILSKGSNPYKKINSFLSEEGYNPDRWTLQAMIDIDENNTYVLLHAYKKYNDLFGRDMVLSFETPFDKYYNMTYRDASAMDILHDLAVLTNSYLYIDADKKVYLFPRGSALRSISLPRSCILELETETTKIDDVSVDIQRYEEDSEGRVNSYGVRVRKNEWDAIKSFYKNVMEGDQVETTAKLFEPGDVRLADQVTLGDIECGVIITRKRGLLEPITEITCEKITENEA
jgi:hypothetical protein